MQLTREILKGSDVQIGQALSLIIELQMAADDVHVAYAEEEKQYRKAGRMLSELWYQDGINNVDNTVSALNIGLFYDGSVDFYPVTQPTVLFNLERTTLYRGHTLLFAQVRGHELLRNDVIGQDILQLVSVF